MSWGRRVRPISRDGKWLVWRPEGAVIPCFCHLSAKEDGGFAREGPGGGEGPEALAAGGGLDASPGTEEGATPGQRGERYGPLVLTRGVVTGMMGPKKSHVTEK